MKYRIIIEQDEDGIFVAECFLLPGCISQGKTRKEAIENIQDAIKGYLESLKKHNEPIPLPITEEIYSLMDLKGLGKEIWTNVDVEKYINNERNLWE